MRLVIAAVGKIRAEPAGAIMKDYAARAAAIGRNIGFTGPDIHEVEAPRALAGAARQAREGELLSAAIPEGAKLVLLDERGKNLNSEDFAAALSRWRDDGAAAAAFLIGGADGHDADMRRRADLTLSFGAATWPHLLVRAMLTEQLYRAMTILSGHPYHRA